MFNKTVNDITLILFFGMAFMLILCSGKGKFFQENQVNDQEISEEYYKKLSKINNSCVNLLPVDKVTYGDLRKYNKCVDQVNKKLQKRAYELKKQAYQQSRNAS